MLHTHREQVDKLKAYEDRGDVALRDKVSGHGGGGLGLDLVILEVVSNLNNSII